MSGVVGVLHYPWGEDYGISSASRRTPRRIYRRSVAFKANPRNAQYMHSLFRERHDGAVVRTDVDGWRDAVRTADRVVLLYPDATGLGFRPLERELRDLSRGDLSALNGRRREFGLDPKTLTALRVRRVLERSMIPEALALLALIFVTPVLLVIDLVRGRR